MHYSHDDNYPPTLHQPTAQKILNESVSPLKQFALTIPRQLSANLSSDTTYVRRLRQSRRITWNVCDLLTEIPTIEPPHKASYLVNGHCRDDAMSPIKITCYNFVLWATFIALFAQMSVSEVRVGAETMSGKKL